MLGIDWQRSTRCNWDQGQCVEVRQARGDVQIRDSRDPIGAPPTVSREDWSVFVAGVKAGEFDLT